MLLLMTKQQQSLTAWWPRCSAARERAHRWWWPWTQRKSPSGSSLWSRAAWRRWRQRPAGTHRQRTRSSRSPGTSVENTECCSMRHAHSVSLSPVALSVCYQTNSRWGRGRSDPAGTTSPSVGSPSGRRTPSGRTAERSHCGRWVWCYLVVPRRWNVVKLGVGLKWKPKEHHQLHTCLHLLLLLCSNV